ncbi:MAG: hypothetical protein QOF89_3758 [Acidobacteriota bacterium]|jgi:thiopeptide-type bacteriocin biosynthesis protein|nr:hypothetical protein [Acidobacteriota bacterium]
MSSPTSAEQWLSFHIFYHTGDRDRLLIHCVLPTVAELLREEWIESFFFVRYLLGGPHVRLRLRSRLGREDALREAVERQVSHFLRCYPSPAPLASEAIHDMNRSLLHQDHNEQEDVIYPDNSFQEHPFLPETDRYGGPSLLAHSLDFFALSSAKALRLLAERGDSSAGRWLTTALRLLASHVLGFARDPEDLKRLSDYSARFWEAGAPPIQEVADRVFTQRRNSFLALVSEEIGKLSLDLPSLADVAMAHALDQELLSAEAATRWRILSSQLHMTANRLGLRNADEIYLARMLFRSLDEIEPSSPQLWARLTGLLAERAASHGVREPRLRGLLRPAFAEILPRTA